MSLFTRNAGSITPVVENYDYEEYVSESDAAAFMAVAIKEGCSPEEIDEIVGEAGEEEDSEVQQVIERSIVKLDKDAKKKQARKLALFQIGKEKGDKEYKKLISLWKLEKILVAKLEKKRGSAADKRSKEIYARMLKSKKKNVIKAGLRGAKILAPKPKKI